MRKTNNAGRELVVDEEGFRTSAYPDPLSPLGQELLKPLAKRRPNWQCLPGDPWTIGIGATGKGIAPGVVWTSDQIWERFEHDIEQREKEVARAVKVELNDNQFAALVSLFFNLGATKLLTGDEKGGPCDLLTKLNSGDYLGAANEFPRWDKSRGRRVAGLHTRRLRERALFLTPVVQHRRVG